VLRLVGHLVAVWLLLHALSACKPQKRQSDADASRPLPAPAVPAQSGTPNIDFDDRAHDFGLVSEGRPLRHVFRVTNKGTAPLQVSEVTTSCGCTAATLGSKTIPPGSSEPLEVKMDTHGRHGEGTRTITLVSNDPRQPVSTLQISYDIERLLDLDRPFVDLTPARGRQPVERVWLTGRLVEQARLRVVAVEGSPFVTARTVEIYRGGQLRKGVALKLSRKAGTSGEGGVTMKTGLQDPPELSLAFRYSVR
jgi:hypothetical protein